MRKLVRRSVKMLVILIALCAGYIAAGSFGHYLPGASVSLAAQDDAKSHDDKEHVNAGDGNTHEKYDKHDKDTPDHVVAQTLVTRDIQGKPSQPEWYRPVIYIGVGLFAAALLIGIVATVTGSPLQAIGLDKDEHHDDDHH